MEASTPPLHKHLSEWTRPELASAADAVEAMRESEGWKALERAIEDYLHNDQRIVMLSPAHGDPARYERRLGQWAGVRQVASIAEGIVRAGKQAEREMREAA